MFGSTTDNSFSFVALSTFFYPNFSPKKRSRSTLGRFLKSAGSLIFFATALLAGTAQAQAEPKPAAGGAGTASAVIAGVSLVSSWINGQDDNAAAAAYAAQWGSDCELKQNSQRRKGFYSAMAKAEVDEHCGWAAGLGFGQEGLLGYWAHAETSGKAWAVAAYAKQGQSHNAYAWAEGSVDGNSDANGEGTPGIGPQSMGSTGSSLHSHEVFARFDPSATLESPALTPLIGAGLGMGASALFPNPDVAKRRLVRKVLRDIGAAPGEVYAILLLDELDMVAPKGEPSTASSWTGQYRINGREVASVSASLDGEGELSTEGLEEDQYSSEYDPDSDSYTLSVSSPVVVGTVYLGRVPTRGDAPSPSGLKVQVEVDGKAEAEDANSSSIGTHSEITEDSTLIEVNEH